MKHTLPDWQQNFIIILLAGVLLFLMLAAE